MIKLQSIKRSIIPGVWPEMPKKDQSTRKITRPARPNKGIKRDGVPPPVIPGVMAQSMSTIEIALLKDASDILEIQKEAFVGQAPIYDNYQLPPIVQSLNSLKSDFTKYTFLKVVLNASIIGSVRFKIVDGHVTIERLVVKPEHQNHGIGTDLMKAVESNNPDAESFQLFTGNKSERNIHIYEKLSYKTVYRETTDQGIELLHMMKKP